MLWMSLSILDYDDTQRNLCDDAIHGLDHTMSLKKEYLCVQQSWSENVQRDNTEPTSSKLSSSRIDETGIYIAPNIFSCFDHIKANEKFYCKDS